jgi:dTDP-glucose pyrophosphorylase
LGWIGDSKNYLKDQEKFLALNADDLHSRQSIHDLCRQKNAILVSQHPNPERFGVVEFDENGKVLSIEEKPKIPKSKYAIPGIYIFDSRVIEISKCLKPSQRNELEIVDLHKAFMENGELDVIKISGAYFDAGTHDALLEASNYIKDNRHNFKLNSALEDAIKEFNIEFKKRVSLKIH